MKSFRNLRFFYYDILKDAGGGDLSDLGNAADDPNGDTNGSLGVAATSPATSTTGIGDNTTGSLTGNPERPNNPVAAGGWGMGGGTAGASGLGAGGGTPEVGLTDSSDNSNGLSTNRIADPDAGRGKTVNPTTDNTH